VTNEHRSAIREAAGRGGRRQLQRQLHGTSPMERSNEKEIAIKDTVK
jgi:hypothetical protein